MNEENDGSDKSLKKLKSVHADIFQLLLVFIISSEST